ncbi:MAG: ORF6N domain-containing protein [Flavobacteriales bacterium]|nr:ORF6N domain-containing protein [Flavobacteriales bacterium]
MANTDLIPAEKIDRSILLIRGQKVMLDTDLAQIYGVKTKRLNEQLACVPSPEALAAGDKTGRVKRSADRFPSDFMFQLTKEEKDEVVANCDHLQNLKYSTTNPFAFTEHGTVMLASVLSSPVAVSASIQIVRAFVKLREMLATNKDLTEKLGSLERKYDHQFKVVFDALRELMNPLKPKRARIGFKIGNNK